jgi:F-type H+-transporting ATPase subunit O
VLVWHIAVVAVALAEENALSASLKVAEIYEQLMLAYKKEVHCTLVTAEVGPG